MLRIPRCEETVASGLGRSTAPARKQLVVALTVELVVPGNFVADDTVVVVVGDGTVRHIRKERGEVTGEQPGIVDMPPERVAVRRPSGKNSRNPAEVEESWQGDAPDG